MPTDSLIGRRFDDRYQILHVLGEGGMGIVYAAIHLKMDRPVALKVLKKDRAKDPILRKRFLREMQVTSTINHPNTITVFDYGESAEGEIYLAMELLEGQELTDLVAEGPLPVDRAVRITVQVLRALGAAHDAGVIHRDLKPANIFLVSHYGESDAVKVLDFGIARFIAHAANESLITAKGMLVGSPLYMSPEQIIAEDLDHRSDLYAVGCLLFHLLTGQPPYPHQLSFKILYMHINEAVPSPRGLNQEVPEPLDRLVMDLLAKDREDRPRSVGEVLDRLERYDDVTEETESRWWWPFE